MFTKIIGTGGVGTGEVYRLEHNHTLGREESRGGHLLDYRDFCKLHIILHYISVLSRDMGLEIKVFPVSAVGDDARGQLITDLMAGSGMDLRYLKILKGSPTLHSVCFQYPDGAGGNITECESACSRVDREFLSGTEKEMDSQTIVLAAPEVPLPGREAFIMMAKQRGAFVAASFISSEIRELKSAGLFRHIDLLALNMDEARILSKLPESADPGRVAEKCRDFLTELNPELKLTVTNGVHGSFASEREEQSYIPAYKVTAVNTAGAGDAYLAGLIIGIMKGMPFTGSTGESCQQLATSLSSMSVTSGDTIHFGITYRSLRAFMQEHATILRPAPDKEKL
jgi:ribokinase